MWFVFRFVWNDYSISFVCVRNMKEKRKREKIGENFISDISFYKKMPPVYNNYRRFIQREGQNGKNAPFQGGYNAVFVRGSFVFADRDMFQGFYALVYDNNGGIVLSYYVQALQRQPGGVYACKMLVRNGCYNGV